MRKYKLEIFNFQPQSNGITAGTVLEFEYDFMLDGFIANIVFGSANSINFYHSQLLFTIKINDFTIFEDFRSSFNIKKYYREVSQDDKIYIKVKNASATYLHYFFIIRGYYYV